MELLTAPLVAAGAKPPHLERVRRVWLSGRPLDAVYERDWPRFSARARAAVEELAGRLDALARVESAHPSQDGSERLLVRLADGRRVESVLLSRGALCVSTQAGCAVGCTFCSTGALGLERQLTAEEVLAQVVLARCRRPVRRVVFMGMGEPAHNLDATLAAITELGQRAGIAHKGLVFSTVGEPRAFARLAANAVQPALALSLHTTDATLRAELLPRAPAIEPRALLDAALAYAEETRYPLLVQWTLLAGVNDGDRERERLVEWLRGARVIVNYIPYNPVPGAVHGRTSWERAHALTSALHAAGIKAKLRDSAGQDVQGACGQLRAASVTTRSEGTPTCPER